MTITSMNISAEYRIDGSTIAYFSASFSGTPGSITMTKQIYDRAAYVEHKADVDGAFDTFELKAMSLSSSIEG